MSRAMVRRLLATAIFASLLAVTLRGYAADLSDLPLDEVPARNGASQRLASFISGDGGGVGTSNLRPVKIGKGHHFSGLMQDLAQAIVDGAEAAFAGSPAIRTLDRAETAFADVNDAHGAIGLIDSGFSSSHAGKDRAAWQQLYTLNELVHENGHVVHMMAIHTRPAFMDLGDSLFVEAFADVPSWSTYEPAWQQKYLGKSAAEPASLRALYSNVMLDVAWALFELRMLRVSGSDPNAVWTDITSRYLHIIPHRELSWWAVRVQLVDLPGYMVNYGLGAVLTADIRQRIEEQPGPFETGNENWNQWLSDRLLNSGQERQTATLLRDFLGRPVSPQALLEELRRVEREKAKND